MQMVCDLWPKGKLVDAATLVEHISKLVSLAAASRIDYSLVLVLMQAEHRNSGVYAARNTSSAIPPGSCDADAV